MQFTWDASKAETNARKHGVTFEEASTVFEDDRALYIGQDHTGERRLVVIGFSAEGRVLFVVSAELEGEVLRIISARKAERHERKAYEHG
jgi:uncharacterized DUF497 family protein